MSGTEYHTGKLIRIQQFETLEETAKFHLQALGYIENDIGDYSSSWLDYALYETNLVHVYNGKLYRIDDTTKPTEGFADAEQNEDGTISYDMLYYNGGGGSFGEVLDSALEKMNDKD